MAGHSPPLTNERTGSQLLTNQKLTLSLISAQHRLEEQPRCTRSESLSTWLRHLERIGHIVTRSVFFDCDQKSGVSSVSSCNFHFAANITPSPISPMSVTGVLEPLCLLVLVVF